MSTSTPPDLSSPQLTPAQREIADGVITSLAGPDARLRPDQETAVAALAAPGARVLVVQATGWGKSAVYWAATAVIRGAGGGPTLIVSPLLSLMRDQVAAATRGGLRAATVNSANIDDWAAIEQDLLSGSLDVLLVSPERLANPGFGRRVLEALAGKLGLVVIDEAHAISDWGHDFRPDYRRVSDVLQSLNPQTSVLATTATANARVTADVADQLGNATLVLRGPLGRKSLHLNVIDGLDPLQRYAWVAQELPMLPGSGIVYVLTVADADRLVKAIRALHGDDYAVAAYTGGLPPDDRHRLEDDLLAGRVKALVATSALGMGFDKPDLGFVVHVGAPPSPVSYYQQVGRAGRALDEAVVMLLASTLDDAIWEHFATATIPDPDRMERLLEALRSADGPMTVPGLESATGIRRGRVELMCKQLAVDGAVERTSDGWLVTGKPWTYDAEHYEGVLAVRRREADIMRSFIRGEKCLMRLLTESLDDPRSEDCGQCSVCRGEITPGLAEAPAIDVVRTVGGVLRRDADILEPRKMWPGGEFGTRGRIPPGAMAEVGRVLAFADAPQWRDVLNAVRSGNERAVAALSEAAVNVVAAWGKSSGVRPDLICSLDLTGGALAATLAARLREVGKRGGGPLEVMPGQLPGRDATGGTEAAYWRDHLGPVPAVQGAVLLVIDETSSGWPVTLAAAALREAGASAVLPLVIHRTA
ncbi:RecQ family ATP-dependent DNA helicase [Gordonia sp. (in: high G+C Gram-positive bacteria)]|uniref:RecQ family ATP-dependent DNA helicase n=1 Tax=Gordonia sp. (in: high G+C Gram-positive bacteria) TaxID=84139 RepID=UPI003C71142A